MSFFGRTVQVTIGNPGDIGILVEDLRMRFVCKKTQSSNDPNNCVVDIYNLNETRRNNINDIDDILVLAAGYEEATGLQDIFVGDIKDVRSTLERPNVITSIEVGDGQKFITENRQSHSFAAGSTVRQVLNAITKEAKSEIDNNLDLITFTDLKFNYGYHFAGDTKRALDELTDMVGISWSVQNNVIKFDKEAILDFEAIIVMDSEHGLIGSPERIKIKRAKKTSGKDINGWRVKSLLVPDANPGGRVSLSSREVGQDKIFKIINVEHVGDNWVDEFTTTMELQAI
jgi:hypothetical protein